jgi:hypothetical protein
VQFEILGAIQRPILHELGAAELLSQGASRFGYGAVPVHYRG